jgi:hypothetical protein
MAESNVRCRNELCGWPFVPGEVEQCPYCGAYIQDRRYGHLYPFEREEQRKRWLISWVGSALQRSGKPLTSAILRPVKTIGLNPLDWLQLYIWMFFRPNGLPEYRERFGEDSTRAVGEWLSATMVLLPLFIPLLAAHVGALEWRSVDFLGMRLAPPLLLAAVVGLWLASGITGYLKGSPGAGLIVAVGVAVGVVVGVVGVVVGVWVGVLFGVAVVASVMEKLGNASPAVRALLGLGAPISLAILTGVSFLG